MDGISSDNVNNAQGYKKLDHFGMYTNDNIIFDEQLAPLIAPEIPLSDSDPKQATYNAYSDLYKNRIEYDIEKALEYDTAKKTHTVNDDIKIRLYPTDDYDKSADKGSLKWFREDQLEVIDDYYGDLGDQSTPKNIVPDEPDIMDFDTKEEPFEVTDYLMSELNNTGRADKRAYELGKRQQMRSEENMLNAAQHKHDTAVMMYQEELEDAESSNWWEIDQKLNTYKREY
jgi:hypothetical protein